MPIQHPVPLSVQARATLSPHNMQPIIKAQEYMEQTTQATAITMQSIGSVSTITAMELVNVGQKYYALEFMAAQGGYLTPSLQQALHMSQQMAFQAILQGQATTIRANLERLQQTINIVPTIPNKKTKPVSFWRRLLGG